MAATDSRRVERRRQEIGCYRSEDGAKNSVVKDGVRRGRKFRKEGTTDPSIVNTKSGGGKREGEKKRRIELFTIRSHVDGRKKFTAKLEKRRKEVIYRSRRD